MYIQKVKHLQNKSLRFPLYKEVKDWFNIQEETVNLMTKNQLEQWIQHAHDLLKKASVSIIHNQPKITNMFPRKRKNNHCSYKDNSKNNTMRSDDGNELIRRTQTNNKRPRVSINTMQTELNHITLQHNIKCDKPLGKDSHGLELNPGLNHEKLIPEMHDKKLMSHQ